MWSSHEFTSSLYSRLPTDAIPFHVRTHEHALESSLCMFAEAKHPLRRRDAAPRECSMGGSTLESPADCQRPAGQLIDCFSIFTILSYLFVDQN